MSGSVDTKYPVNTSIGAFMKAHGGTVVCSYGYGISPSSSRSAIGTNLSFVHAGGKSGVLDTSIPFGSVAMTTPALTAKQKGCNAYYAGLDDNSNDALATALQQEGVKPKVMVFPTGYDSQVIGTPAWKAVQGGYFETEFRPFSLPNAGTQQMKAALDKYAHFTGNEFPSFSQYESWLGADLMIKGLQMAGPTASHADVIKALRSIKSYNGNGLLPENINYTNDFGKDLPKSCGWYMKAEKTSFVAVSSQPWCGTDIPGTTTVSEVGTLQATDPSPRRDWGHPVGSVLDGDGVLRTGAHGGLAPSRATPREDSRRGRRGGRRPGPRTPSGPGPCRARCSRTDRNQPQHASVLPPLDPVTAEATRRAAPARLIHPATNG